LIRNLRAVLLPFENADVCCAASVRSPRPRFSDLHFRRKAVADSVAALLSTESPSLRLQHVTHVLIKQLSIAEVSTKIATAVDESLSKQQKALFLRQQLAAINAELQRLEPGNTDLHGTGSVAEDEDDLDALVRRVDALPAGTEVRRVASTEARRLRRIPPQNAEHGVVRNYVRTRTFFHALCLTLRSAAATSSNGLPHCHGLHHPLAQTPLRGRTFSQTQSRNLMRTTLALIRSNDG
jgi:hypothetical protein